MIRKSSIFLLCFALSGCAVGPIAAVGVTSLAVNETTGKGIIDHTNSMIEGKDCRMSRYLKDQQVCQDRKKSNSEETVVSSPSAGTDQIQALENVFTQRKKLK